MTYEMLVPPPKRKKDSRQPSAQNESFFRHGELQSYAEQTDGCGGEPADPLLRQGFLEIGFSSKQLMNI